VSFVDHAQVERFRYEQRIASLLAPGGFAPDQEHAVTLEAADAWLALARIDIEELKELLTPLSQEWFRRDEKHSPCGLREELRNHEPRFDRFPEANLVGQDATAFADPCEGEDDGFDLVRVRVDLRRTLRSRVPAALVRAAKAYEVFGEVAPLGGM
jgi:hypothetical protein